MNRKHAVTISVAAGLAAIAGTVAATKSVQLGRAATPSTTDSSALIAKRAAQLDRTEIALRKALKQKPPKLPPLSAAPARRVVYVRPAPIVRHVRRAGGEHEYEYERGGEHESGQLEHGDGGGFDD